MLSTIDTRQGTNNSHGFSNGNTLPYTGVPFGMNHFAVQTANEGSWFFNPNHRTFQGIRLTHQPSPWMGDFSYLLMTPVTGSKFSADIFSYQSSYRPEEAVFQPHYLKVKQLRYQLHTEFSPTERGGFLRITPALNSSSEEMGMIFSAPGESQFQLHPQENSLTGFINHCSGCESEVLKLYFKIVFDQPLNSEASGYWSDGDFISETSLSANEPTFLVRFAQQQVTNARIGTSFISPEQAELNLAREVPESFEATKTQAAQAWEHYLRKIKVTDKDQEQVKTFYTCLYRMFLFPQKFYELDSQQQPIHFNTTTSSVASGYLYTNNGFWDTYKTVYPLYSLIATKEYQEMLAGFLTSYQETGYLPKWLSPDERGLMPGTLIDAVIADAATKGLIETDMLETFLTAMIHAATVQSDKPNYGRQGTLDYLKYGYVPITHHESVNHTQDYAYSDFCIAQVATVLGKHEIAEKYLNSSKNYQNLFDQASGFMRGKDTAGNFRPDFDPFSWGRDYTEGSAWQNSFAVFHDFQGLIQLHGGEAAFSQKLTDLCNEAPVFDVLGYGFEIHEMSEMAAVDFGQLALSNQPSFHLPYLFNYVGQPASSQVLLKQLMTKLFNSGFDGFPGDEDNGSMSGWYVFSALGFYPVTPGSGEYVFGIPLFDHVSIQLDNGNIIELNTENNHPQHQFVAVTQVNGLDWNPLFIHHDELIKGVTINRKLGLVPASSTNYVAEDKPFSITGL